jgi:tetratricopeptide (TPR) repeat protein
MIQEDKIETDKLIKKIKRLAGRALLTSAVGKWNETMEIIKNGNDLINLFQGNLPKELEDAHCNLLYAKSSVHVKKGLLGLLLKQANEYIEIARSYNNKMHIAISTYLFGNYYWRTGDLDRAFEYIESAIALIEDCYNNDNHFPVYWITEIYYHAIEIGVERKEHEQARKYLERLREIYKLKPNDHVLRNMYKLCKANYLRSSKRVRDRAKAEELFKEVCKAKMIFDWFLTTALVRRCELLLLELKLTDEIEIIDEIKPLLKDLIDIAQERESDYLLMQTYVIQGKLALLTFDMKMARRFLVQGQRIAERRRYKSFADKIARLHKNLKGELDQWEQLKQSNAPFSERIKLARLDEDLSGQLIKRKVDMEQVIEKKVTIYDELKICMVCKGSAVGFNIYICPQCSSIYCKGCAEAVIEIENACWICELPIDESRPSQLIEKEEEKTKFDAKKSKRTPKDKKNMS